MNDKLLLKIALIIAIVGIIALVILVEVYKVDQPIIGNIGPAYIGKDVQITGTVKSVEDRGKFMIISVEQPKTISVFVFKDKNISIEKGATVAITGEIKEYASNYEIVADSIVVK